MMTKEQWKALYPKQRWDVLTAMRGPDMKGSTTLKYFTVAVLRNEMVEILRPTGSSAMMNEHLRMIILPYPMDANSMGAGDFDMPHFLGHVADAASILNVPTLWVPAPSWAKGIRRGHKEALSIFLNGIKVEKMTNPLFAAPMDELVGKAQALLAPLTLPEPEESPNG